MTAFRLSFVSPMVSPWPLAPGTSGQIAQKPPSGCRFDDGSELRLHVCVFSLSGGREAYRGGFDAGDPYPDLLGSSGVRAG